MGEAEQLTSSQRNLVRAVLNRIIPAEGSRPGAGRDSVIAHLERSVGSGRAAGLLLREGLAEIDLIARCQDGSDFLVLAGDRQDEILTLVETTRPIFFEQLVARVYEGYYRDPEVLTAIGHDPGPPQPRGHVLPDFDAAVLDRVRARGPIFRIVRS